MDVRDFDFDLPPDLVAQEPLPERDKARLLVLERRSGALTHATVGALPDYLRAGDLVVVNDTRVFPARLLGRRVPTGGGVECLLVRRIERPDTAPLEADVDGPAAEFWEALVHPGQKLKPGSRVLF